MKRVLWLDLLRIFAIFFVIVIHVACINWGTEIPVTMNWQYLNICDSIARFCVPVFLMISGALILNKKNLDIKKFYKNNILRLIVALLFWSFVYSFFNNLYLFDNFTIKNVKDIVISFNGFHYHLYFLLSLIGLYIITPLLKKIVESENLLNYLLFLCIIFSVIIPSINNILSLIMPNSSNMYILYQSFTNWLFKINIPFVSGWLVFYLTGYKLYNMEKIKNSKLIYILGIVSCLFTICASSYISVKNNQPMDLFYDYNSINVYLMSVALFVFFKNVVSNFKVNDKLEKCINCVAESIFGVYLIHDIFIIFIRRFDAFDITNNYLINVIILSIIVFILSYIFVYFIRKIPKIYKYIT